MTLFCISSSHLASEADLSGGASSLFSDPSESPPSESPFLLLSPVDLLPPVLFTSSGAAEPVSADGFSSDTSALLLPDPPLPHFLSVWIHPLIGSP